MGVIVIVIIGGLTGFISWWLLPGGRTIGLSGTTGMGVAGSVVGGLFNNVLANHRDWLMLHPGGVALPMAGAVLVMAMTGVAGRVLAEASGPPVRRHRRRQRPGAGAREAARPGEREGGAVPGH